MDFQALINTMNENTAKDRSNYHLTYGQLVEVLKAAPADATFDSRVKGIGSWRGSYIEIALFTEDSGYHVEWGEFQNESYGIQFDKEHEEDADQLPANANELGSLLESFISKDFVGYKGGNYQIEEYKPLWLEMDSSTCDSITIIGIDKDLKLITKQIEE